MRRIAALSFSIALAALPGCASLGHPEPSESPEAKPTLPDAPRFDLSRAFQGYKDWAER